MIEKNSGKIEKERLLFLKRSGKRNELPHRESNASPGETITIHPKISLERLRSLTMDRGMGNFFRSFADPPLETKKMLRTLIKDGERSIVTVASNEKNEIIGYIAVLPSTETWFNHEKIYQIGAIEVSREYRKRGVGTDLMKIFDHRFFDDTIVYTFCYSWHWDCSKETITAYREALLKLLLSQNFSEESIDDINIKMDENNIFAVRYGKGVDMTLREEFKKKLI